MPGSKGGAVVRALASHQCGPGSNPGVNAICVLSLLLFLSLAPRGFSSGTPVFPSPQKPTFPNSSSTRNQADEEPLCGCATCKSLFIFIYLFNTASLQERRDSSCVRATNQIIYKRALDIGCHIATRHTVARWLYR